MSSDRFQQLTQLVRQAGYGKREADARFRASIVMARAGGLPLAALAEAADLSVTRVHAILQEEEAMSIATPALTASAADDVVVVAARIAYEEYLHYHAYICQNGRAFRDVHRMGFYRRGKIERHFPSIRAVEDDVLFARENAARLRQTGSPVDREVADLIDTLLDHHKRYEGDRHMVFLLTPPDDPQTFVLSNDIVHVTGGRGSAWTMGQRYVSEARLLNHPNTTNDLD